MSTVKTKNVQVGTDGTASNNFTIYVPGTPDGTVRIGNGDAGAVTDAVTINSSGAVTLANALTVTGNISTSGTIPAAQLTGTLPAIDGSSLTNLPQPAALTTASGSAPSYSARAWVNFNGTGTVAIRGSGNVTSITDHGTGDYTINFSTAMVDANYSVVGAAGKTSINLISLDTPAGSYTQTISEVRVTTPYVNGTLTDATQVNVAIFG